MAIEEGKHVMLSYQWNSQKVVSRVYEILDVEGVKLWMDIKGGMKDDKYKSMAEGVGNAAVICCFLTSDYQASPDCRRELERAADIETEYIKKKQSEKLRIIPCLLVDKNNLNWRPSDWLAIIIAGKLQIRIKDDSESSVEFLAKEIIRIIKDESARPTVDQTPSSSTMFETIRKKYLKESTIKRIVNEGRYFPIENSYINLSIVETKEQHEKEKKLKQQSQHMSEEKNEQDGSLKKPHTVILSTYEEIYGVKTSVDVKDMFQKCKDQIKKVLVLGRAGIGKSTFCQYVTYKWAKGDLWNEYELVVLVYLRKVTSDRYPKGKKYFPVDLLKEEYFCYSDISEKDEDYFHDRCKSGKVLWILDGYDEFVHNIPPQLNDLFKHLRETQHHILTSRPYAAALPYDVQLEIIGFTDDNIIKYIELFFDQIAEDSNNLSLETNKILRFLKSNTSIWGVAHIPVNLELICTAWGNTDWSKTRILTLTVLYDNMIEWLCRRHLTKQNTEFADLVDMETEDVYQECTTELRFLEQLAFKAMESHNILLPPELISETKAELQCTREQYQSILKFGILKSYNDKAIGEQNSTKQQYYFIHLSFQEHFAARHLIYLLKSTNKQKAIDFINQTKYDQRFRLVFIFAAGLVVQSINQPAMQVFWTTIQKEPLDLIGLQHVKLILEIVNEVLEQSLFRERTQYLKSISKWIIAAVKSTTNAVRENLAQSLIRAPAVVNTIFIQNTFSRLLETEDQKTIQNTLYMIKNSGISEPSTKLINVLLNATRDQDDDVSFDAQQALKKISEKATNNDMIAALLHALSDPDKNVRSSACEAIGNVGEKAVTNDVIAALFDALSDPDEDVRFSACEAIGEVGKKAATDYLTAALLNVLSSPDKNVRSSACEIIRDIGSKAANDDVIAALLKALTDPDKHVRSLACEAIGEIGEKAATNDVIDALLILLSDSDKYARQSASEALGTLGRKALTDSVTAVLVKALNNRDKNVRSAACMALGEIGEKAATDDVIYALLRALSDPNKEVRSSACEAIGGISEKAATDGVIAALLNAMGDPDKNVRQNASAAIGNIGAKASNNAVTAALLKALSKRDKYVRASVCEAIGEIGEKAATNDVMTALLKALNDPDKNVRQNAVEAIGRMGEKAATRDVIDAVLKALDDPNEDIRSSACEALRDMSEKAASSDVIDALIGALDDSSEDIRSSACEVLGRMGEKAATNDVIDALLNLLSDEDDYIIQNACEALGKVSKTVATNDVITALLKTLSNADEDIRTSASDALGEMGEKVATNDMVASVLDAATAFHGNERDPFAKLVEINVSLNKNVKNLRNELILATKKLLEGYESLSFKTMNANHLLNSYFDSGNDAFLGLVAYAALVQGIAITVVGEKITVYKGNEVPSSWKPDSNMLNRFVETLNEQKKKLETIVLNEVECAE